MKITWSETIRGVDVDVVASQWDGDESVGIPYGPECIEACDMNGEPFDLTDDEIDQLIITAGEIYFSGNGPD